MRYSVTQPRGTRPVSPDQVKEPEAVAETAVESNPVSPSRAPIPRPRPSERPPVSKRKSAGPAVSAANRKAVRESPEEPLAAAVAEDEQLVLTVAPSDWNLPSRNAIVGHGAVRVAIAPGHGPGGTLMVRPLKAGEVAPRGSTVAVLVALEPGARLPDAGPRNS